MKTSLQLILFCLVLTLSLAVASPLASAKYVTMSTSLGSTAIPEGARAFNLSLEVANSGDDTAYRVSVSAWSALQDITGSEAGAGDLSPGAGKRVMLPLSIASGANKGTYGFAVITHYQDGNGYAFSAVTPTILSLGEARAASTLQIDPPQAILEEKGSGTLGLTVRNLGESPVSADVFIVLPQELSSGGTSYPMQHVQLSAKNSQELFFPLAAFSALAGSTYSIAAVGQQNGATPLAVISRGTVAVTKPSSPAIFLVGAFILLILAIGILAYLKFVKNK